MLSLIFEKNSKIKDYERIESGIMFDSKSCLWTYLEEAIQIDPVIQEPRCPKLINETYSQMDKLLTVSDHPANLKLFNLFTVKQCSVPTEFDNLHNEIKMAVDEV